MGCRSSSAVNQGTHLHGRALRSFPPISHCRNFIKSLLHLCSLYCPIQVLRAECCCFPMQEGGKKSTLCSKSEETRGAPLKSSPLFLRSPHLFLHGQEAVTMGPAIFKNILKLPAKGENGTFALVFLHLMALPAMPCPPWAIN